MINIDSDLLELIGLDKCELYDLFLSSKNEDDFIDKLEIDACIEEIDLPPSKYFDLDDIYMIKIDLIAQTKKQVEDIYYFFTQNDKIEGYSGLEYQVGLSYAHHERDGNGRFTSLVRRF